MELSFEFFPPKTSEGEKKLFDVAQTLMQYHPAFFSVTYGAGGSTQNKTMDMVCALHKVIRRTIVPHISCVGATKSMIADMLDQYRNQGIKRMVVLRGDLPSGEGSFGGEFQYASDLVSFIRDYAQDYFYIDVAVYPEYHPFAKNCEDDFHFFKQKVACGANSAITQYFYDPNAYYWLLEKCRKNHVHIPITPGVMPITNFHQLTRFSHQCGSEIPRWLMKKLEHYADDQQAIFEMGAEIVSHLCEQLIAMGAPGLHFYTLNKSDACIQILKNLMIRQTLPEKELVFNE